MKKITFTLALLLCFALCALAFASCGKKGADETTEAPTTTAAPSTTEAPTTTAAQATTEAPTTTAAQATTEAPTTTAAQATTEAPATTAAPATTEAPTTTEAPVTTAAPETTEEPATTAHVHVPADEYTIVIDPTCTTEGYQAYLCKTCGEIITETYVEIPPTGHTPADEYTVVIPATCDTDGIRAYYCTTCGEVIPETVVEIPAAHTPKSTYTFDVAPTCMTGGSKSYHCAVCGLVIPGTEVELESDPDAHVVTDWIVTDEATFFVTGNRHGVCSLCGTEVAQEYAYEPTVFNSKTAENVSNGDPNYGKGSYYLTMNAEDFRGENHFYPTEDDPEGRDLWFEYSLLWNPTLAEWGGLIEIASFRMQGGDEGTFKDFYRLATGTQATECPYAGRFNFATAMPRLSPKYACVLDPENGQPIYKGSMDGTVTENSFPSIGEYGWHRIGFHFHSEVTVDEDRPYPKAGGSAILYTAYSELYIDGVLVWKVQTNAQGNWNGTEWKDRPDGLRINGIELFKASKTQDNASAIQYGDVWYWDNAKLIVEMKLQDVLASESAVYVVVDDAYWTCGSGFVRDVVPDEDPVERTFVLDDGVEVPGTIYFKYAE